MIVITTGIPRLFMIIEIKKSRKREPPAFLYGGVKLYRFRSRSRRRYSKISLLSDFARPPHSSHVVRACSP